MLETLIIKELLSQLRTLRLVVALVFTVMLCVLTTLMGSFEFSGSVEAYEQTRQEQQQELDEATIYQRLRPNVLVPPQPLTILARGAVDAAAMQFSTNLEYRRMATGLVGSAAFDDLMLILVRTDLTTVVALLLSFLAVVLGFDAVCGEREQGTLKLLLANPIPRHTVIAAKLIGGALVLWIPLVLAFVVSLLLLLVNPDVHFSNSDWVRLTLMLALSCLVLFQVYALSVLVSTLTRSPATSLILCLFAWLLCGVGYANTLPALMRYGIEYPPYAEFMVERDDAVERRNRDYDDWRARHPAPGPAFDGVYVDGVLRYAHPEGIRFLAEHARFDFDRRLEFADEEFRYRWPNQRPLAEQEWAVDRWSILSPLTSYRTLCKWLARSTLDDRFEVARYGMQYRRAWVQWMRGRLEADGWRRWFTDDPPGQEPMITDPASVTPDMLADDSEFMRRRHEWAAAQNERALRDPRRHLDLTGMPRPDPEAARRGLGESLSKMLPGLLMMLVTLVAAVLLTIRQFSRYPLN